MEFDTGSVRRCYLAAQIGKTISWILMEKENGI